VVWKHEKVRYSAPNDSTVIQRAVAAALTGPQDYVVDMRQVYQHRRDLAVNLLKELSRYVYTPHGAFYILVDVSYPGGTGRRGRQFALDVLCVRNIALAPGSTFGSVAEHYVRVSLAASDDEIERGMRECAPSPIGTNLHFLGQNQMFTDRRCADRPARLGRTNRPFD
jgi:aspartate/methionine/tyrosine aminotransferase